MRHARSQSGPIRFSADPRRPDEEFARHVRDALTHLHDLPQLQTHPLAALAAGSAPAGETRGRALRRALVQALADLRETPGRRGPVDGAAAELLRMRYDEALSVEEVIRRVSISRAEYYRRHDRALAAMAALLRKAWGDAPAAPPGPAATVRDEQPGHALPAPSAPAATLPRALTRFVGRARELADVADLLAGGTPLLTLAGAGGCGKTRLAHEVARRVSARYPGGMWLAELQDLSDPELVPQRVASVLGLDDRPGLAPTQRLIGYLRERRALLVLDNCEHLLNASATLIDALLRECPSLQVLTTTREPLAADGETIWRIPSLSLPPEDAGEGDLMDAEAVRLFVDRAQAARPGFALTEANGPAVADLCRRLDGIPLAIELAAARLRALSPQEIGARLGDRFALLTRDGGALPRHRTLRGLIDWSHDLLSEPERRLFARLAVFPAAWDLSAAEAICGAEPHPEGTRPGDVFELLRGLVDKSLALAEPHGDGTRYRMLETLRAYARERLAEAGEEDATRARHAAHYVALAETAEPRLRGPEQRAWIERLERDQPSMHAALEWSIGRDEAALALRLIGAQAWFWHQRGHWRTGYAQSTRALALAGAASDPARARVLCGAGLLATDLGMHEDALHWLNDALAQFGAKGDEAGRAEALNTLGLAATGRDEGALAEEYFGQALRISAALGDRWGVGRALMNLGELAQGRRDWPAARAALGRAAEELRAAGALAGVGIVLGNLARLAHVEGAHGEARRLYRESLSLHRDLGIRYRVVECLQGLASLEAEDGSLADATALLEEALRAARDMDQASVAAEIARDLAAARAAAARSPGPALAPTR
jgi:predicted ATPase